MRILKKHNLIMVFVLMLALVIGVSVFSVPEKKAFADSPATYTVTFKKSGKEADSVLSTITVNAGGSVLESQLPLDKLPQLDNGTYIWFYSADNNSLTKLSVTGNADNEILTNISSDITIWAIAKDTSERHKVTFIMPDTTIVTKTVVDGGTVDAPIPDLGFCQRAKYDKSLKNIKSDMTVNVSIDNTLKYIFVAISFALLITSLVVIVTIVFKALRVPDDDDEDGLAPIDNKED